MPPDVLAQQEQPALRVEQPRGMDSAGCFEQLLGRPKGGRERDSVAGVTTGPAAGGSATPTVTWSSDALPQIPQLAVAAKLRPEIAAGSSARARCTVISFSGCASVATSPMVVRTTSPA